MLYALGWRLYLVLIVAATQYIFGLADTYIYFGCMANGITKGSVSVLYQSMMYYTPYEQSVCL